MKVTKTLLVLIAFTFMVSTGCSNRLVDFTVISSKNADIGLDRSKGVQTSGSKSYVFGFGWNLKDAMDKALQNAGPQYDLLVDGVVRTTSYVFVLGVKVEGVAVASNELRAEMGEEKYQEWLKTSNLFDPDSYSLNESD